MEEYEVLEAMEAEYEAGRVSMLEALEEWLKREQWDHDDDIPVRLIVKWMNEQ